MVIAVLVCWAVLGCPLSVLTALGARRRGMTMPLATIAGLAFPVTWTVWYLHDEAPF